MPSTLFGVGSASSKPGFDLLLIGHVACTLFGFGALVTSGIQAIRLLRRGLAGPGDTLRRYFAPGVNWVGRVLYGVPVFGFALLGDSNGHLRIGYPWVVAGLVLWSLAALAAEGFLWPAERRIQLALVDAMAVVPPRSLPQSVRRDCRMIGLLGAVLAVIFLTATVLMVGRPH